MTRFRSLNGIHGIHAIGTTLLGDLLVDEVCSRLKE
jgi:hypothetical protein